MGATLAVNQSEKKGFVERRSTSVIGHLHGMEEERITAVARELHDELGGLLVGAMMDLAWIKQRMDAHGEMGEKLARAQQTLSQAISRTRRMVEELRPSLLENVGLFAALRWHVKEVCDRAGLRFSLELPEQQPSLSPSASIVLYRIIEALLSAILRGAAEQVTVNITLDKDVLVLRLANERESAGTVTDDPRHPGEFTSIAYRVSSIGGTISVALQESTILGATARFSLARLA
jgi:signal transduction histidine kinase